MKIGFILVLAYTYNGTSMSCTVPGTGNTCVQSPDDANDKLLVRSGIHKV
jgi:hypothetical protein